jgi:hypothetical protein
MQIIATNKCSISDLTLLYIIQIPLIMKKILTSMSMICMLISASFTAHAVVVDATTAGNWKGFMNVFENDNGAQGTYLFGSDWGTTDLRANAQGGDTTILDLRPNTNAYADSLRGTEADRVYWTNSDDGGATPGPDGNKWLEASYFLEAPDDNTAWNGKRLTFSGTISNFTLNNRYSTVAFIKTLDVDDGYATVQNEVFSITSTGDFELSLDIQEGNYVAQMGFTMSGLNANPNTDWGLVELKNLEATVVVPEPSTYALLAGFAVFLFVAIRQRK